MFQCRCVMAVVLDQVAVIAQRDLQRFRHELLLSHVRSMHWIPLGRTAGATAGARARWDRGHEIRLRKWFPWFSGWHVQGHSRTRVYRHAWTKIRRTMLPEETTSHHGRCTVNCRGVGERRESEKAFQKQFPDSETFCACLQVLEVGATASMLWLPNVEPVKIEVSATDVPWTNYTGFRQSYAGRYVSKVYLHRVP